MGVGYLFMDEYRLKGAIRLMLSYVFLSWVRAMQQIKWLSGVLLLLLLTPAQALEKLDFYLKDRGSVKRKADAVLALMSYSVILDLASSNLTIQNSGSDKKNLVMSQLGGGDVISETTPLYLEGAIA